HRSSRFHLVAHQTNDIRGRTNELDVAGRADFRKGGRFGQEPVTGMNSVDIKNFGSADDGGDIQVALRRRCRTDACRLISKSDMKGIAIYVAVDRDGTNAHLFASPDYTAGNFAAVGDQYLLELSNFRRHLLSKVESPRSRVLLS